MGTGCSSDQPRDMGLEHICPAEARLPTARLLRARGTAHDLAIAAAPAEAQTKTDQNKPVDRMVDSC